MTPLLSPQAALFGCARAGRRTTPVLLAGVLAWLFLVLSRLPLSAIDGLWPALAKPWAAGQGVTATACLVAGYLAIQSVPLALLVAAWMYWYEGRDWRRVVSSRGRVSRRWWRGLLVGACGSGAIAALGLLCGSVQRAPAVADDGVSGVATLPAVAIVLVGWMVQGSSEELLARGWLVGSLGARYTPWYGVMASAVLFASFHVGNPGFGWLAALNLVLLGIFFALYALWEGDIWGVCALHAGWNWMQGNVLGLSVSGAPPLGGALVDLDSSGPLWSSGGSFGLEGSALATVVASVAVLGMVALLWRRRRGSGHAPGMSSDGTGTAS